MTVPPPDGSRDRRIEDPTNLWLIHPAARTLLPLALKLGISANSVSFVGLALGIGAALCYARWDDPWAVLGGVVLSAGWLVADGLDGMVARATATSSAMGRFLDGTVDHGVFILIYVSLALTIGTAEGWGLAVAAGACHVAQSALYEGERARFHRRAKGVAAPARATTATSTLERGYDRLAGLPDRLALPFERRLAAMPTLARVYAMRAVPAMRLQSLLSANVRVWLIALACWAGNPRLFWGIEIVPLTAVAILGLHLHRRVERGFFCTAQLTRGEPFSAAPATRDL